MAGGACLIADCFAVFVALPLFLGKRSCHFEYDIIISGHQRVEIAENCDGFVASTKKKFLSLKRKEY
jgi:hypothetical protein